MSVCYVMDLTFAYTVSVFIVNLYLTQYKSMHIVSRGDITGMRQDHYMRLKG